jgi:NAD(P)-dependent dehydrogenase (short-subunit alcohol dehydrogenase family)
MHVPQSGIGESICRNFAANGAKAIVVVDINEAGAKRVASEITACPALGMRVNCGSESELRRSVATTEALFGSCDVVCANAGIGQGGGAEVTNEEWDRINNINVMQSVWLARHAVPNMLKRGGGSFLVTASAAGLLTQIGSMPYAVTKAAAVSVAEWLSITYGSQGLQVTCLCPQAVRTAMTAGTQGAGVAGLDGILEPDDVAQQVFDAMSQGRFMLTPHSDVLTYIQRKAKDYDRWVGGMQRLNARMSGIKTAGPSAKL